MQGQCKPNAESSLYAEVQPVLAYRRQSYGDFISFQTFPLIFLQLIATTLPSGDKLPKPPQNLSPDKKRTELWMKSAAPSLRR